MNEGFHLTRANYGCLFREMIRDWREAWGNNTIPFNLVQLHSCDGGNTGQCYDDWCGVQANSRAFMSPRLSSSFPILQTNAFCYTSWTCCSDLLEISTLLLPKYMIA